MSIRCWQRGRGTLRSSLIFLKRKLDSTPVTARALGRWFHVDGDLLGRHYKEDLSDFSTWTQKDHAADWILEPQNMGKNLSIDETSLGEVYTILSNKDGKGRKGSIIAMAQGTAGEDVLPVLERIPEDVRNAVEEVTLDFSPSMNAIVQQAFPKALRTIDCFHLFKLCGDAAEEIRMKYKRSEQSKANKDKREFNARKKKNAARRKKYRKEHPKKYKGKKRGRKPQHINEKFKPAPVYKDETPIEFLTRSRHLILKSADKWSKSQKARARVLFRLYPKMKAAFYLMAKLRVIFRNKKITREQAWERLHQWYKDVSASKLPEMISARDTIKEREEEVLNYFINHSTNASAESLNSKIKLLRAELKGVVDLPYFLFRIDKIFG